MWAGSQRDQVEAAETVLLTGGSQAGCFCLEARVSYEAPSSPEAPGASLRTSLPAAGV